MTGDVTLSDEGADGVDNSESGVDSWLDLSNNRTRGCVSGLRNTRSAESSEIGTGCVLRASLIVPFWSISFGLVVS